MIKFDLIFNLLYPSSSFLRMIYDHICYALTGYPKAISTTHRRSFQAFKLRAIISVLQKLLKYIPFFRKRGWLPTSYIVFNIFRWKFNDACTVDDVDIVRSDLLYYQVNQSRAVAPAKRHYEHVANSKVAQSETWRWKKHSPRNSP